MKQQGQNAIFVIVSYSDEFDKVAIRLDRLSDFVGSSSDEGVLDRVVLIAGDKRERWCELSFRLKTKMITAKKSRVLFEKHNCPNGYHSVFA
ncbi:hypothetical protein CG471_10610 [Sphingobium sp. IP1]|nr:hypothetical protein CG471_10610 [Sphingobium sp. IP1]